MNSAKTNTGFTIVELLIVIVVIAILAAITIVSYNGVTGRAHDVSVQNDMRNADNGLQLYQSLMGRSAQAAVPFSVTTAMDHIKTNDGTVRVVFAKGSYAAPDLYPDAADGTVILGFNQTTISGSPTTYQLDDICIVAKSKSGQNYLYTTRGVIAKTAKIDSLGGAHDFRTACRTEGGIQVTSAMTYAATAL